MAGSLNWKEEGRQGLGARQDARRHHQDRRRVLDRPRMK